MCVDLNLTCPNESPPSSVLNPLSSIYSSISDDNRATSANTEAMANNAGMFHFSGSYSVVYSAYRGYSMCIY